MRGLLGQEKKTVLLAKRFQKAVCRSAHFFGFFKYFVAKITPKKLNNLDFFLLASLAIFNSNFCPKNSWLYIFFVSIKKKISANGQKRSVAPGEQFFFLGLMDNFFLVVVVVCVCVCVCVGGAWGRGAAKLLFGLFSQRAMLCFQQAFPFWLTTKKY